MQSEQNENEQTEVRDTPPPPKKQVGAFLYLLKKWWVFILVLGGSITSGYYYAKNQLPVYESRLTFSLDAGSSDGALSNAMNLAAQFGLGMGSGQSMFEGDNILEIMRSRRMIESVLLSSDTFNSKHITLIQFYLKNSKMSKTLAKNNRFNDVNFPVGSKKGSMSYLQDSLLFEAYQDIAKNALSASRPDKKIGIYEVRVKSLNEKFSKIFTERIVDATSNYYTEITGKKDKETLNILEQRVSSLKGNVSRSIEIKAGVQDANLNPAFAQSQAPIIKQQYNIQSYGKAYEEMYKTLEMARYQYLKKIPLLQIIDKADYPMKRIKLSAAKAAFFFSVIAVLLTAIFLIAFKNARS
jgi:uncharacterized protein involved in exopolysaccharide biosynthesis